MKKNSKASTIMIQGTCSNAGKSIITAGLCRIFTEDGYKTAPFKAQNMALNSYVTEDSLEMGRAQVTQAYACKIKPDVRMNPVLLKPTSEVGSQIIVNGLPLGNMKAKKYYSHKQTLIPEIKKAYSDLAGEYEIIVIEGAGSPVEINLKDHDIVNMYTAKMANAPVLIVGDIDQGGIFASLIGTYDLLEQDEKDLVAGFIINKFRGDIDLFKSGKEIIKQRTGKKVLGIIPMIHDLNLPDEDSVDFKKKKKKKDYDKNIDINIALIDLPYISNFTDFIPFQYDSDVNLYTVDNPDEINDADIILIPGSKNVIHDMEYFNRKGFTYSIKKLSKEKMIIGICGGYQILGKEINDPYSIESRKKSIKALNLLNISTTIEKDKRLSQVNAVCQNYKVKGYEIHHGKTEINETPYIVKNDKVLGCKNSDGNIWGSYIHGLFDNNLFRRHILNIVRKNKGLPLIDTEQGYNLDDEFNKLSNVLRDHLDLDFIYKKMNISRRLK